MLIQQERHHVQYEEKAAKKARNKSIKLLEKIQRKKNKPGYETIVNALNDDLSACARNLFTLEEELMLLKKLCKTPTTKKRAHESVDTEYSPVARMGVLDGSNMDDEESNEEDCVAAVKSKSEAHNKSGDSLSNELVGNDGSDNDCVREDRVPKDRLTAVNNKSGDSLSDEIEEIGDSDTSLFMYWLLRV
jgi:hypothetical protein